MAELTAGSEFAGHRIEALTGRGGMGVVYRATHLSLDRVVALKVIAPQLVEDPAARQRFQRESKLAASIDHPNVIPIYYTGDDDGVAFIAMRFVEGRDLRSLVREHGPLAPARAARIVAQVGAALDAAHASGLVHRDVKPANVLLGPGDHVYLSDFGLSKHALSLSGETRSGHWVGTLDYVAPEQIRGERPDARSDVYALGAVLYFALTGRAPFPREGDEAKLWAHLTEPPPRATDHLPELASDFDDVIARAMAKRPDARYPSAGDLGRAALAAGGLEAPAEHEHAVGVGDAAPEESPTESASARGAAISSSEAPTVVEGRARRRPSRRLALALAGGGALALAGVAGALVAAGGDDPRRRGSAAPSPTATVAKTASKPAQAKVETVARVGGRPNSIAVGNGVVLVTSFRDTHVIRLDAKTGKRMRPRPTVGVGGRDIALGFGGAWVAVSQDKALVRIDPDSGREVARISLAHRPQSVTVGHGAVWVGMSSYEPSSTLPPPVPDSIAKIDPDSNEVVETYPMRAGVRSVVSTPAGIWVINRDLPTATRFNPDTESLAKRVTFVGDGLGGAAYGAGSLWVVLSQDTVVRVDDRTGKKVSIGVGRHPTGIAARGRQVWVTSFIDHTVWRIDPKTSRPAGKPIRAPLNPYKLAVARDSVWLTAVGRGEIARLRLHGER